MSEPKPERLKCCAIIRDEVTHSYGFRSHSEIRAKLGDKDTFLPRRTDEEGYLTDSDRFVDRWEASSIGYKSGQTIYPDCRLLSSEVSWDKRPPVKTSASKSKGGKRWPTKRKLF